MPPKAHQAAEPHDVMELCLLKEHLLSRRDCQRLNGLPVDGAFDRYIFTMVCRGLFDGHKRVFAFLLSVALGRHTGEVPPALLNFLLRGGNSQLTGMFKPDADWISDTMWQVIWNPCSLAMCLSRLPWR